VGVGEQVEGAQGFTPQAILMKLLEPAMAPQRQRQSWKYWKPVLMKPCPEPGRTMLHRVFTSLWFPRHIMATKAPPTCTPSTLEPLGAPV
jgi:hypothetical protein